MRRLRREGLGRGQEGLRLVGGGRFGHDGLRLRRRLLEHRLGGHRGLHGNRREGLGLAGRGLYGFGHHGHGLRPGLNGFRLHGFRLDGVGLDGVGLDEVGLRRFGQGRLRLDRLRRRHRLRLHGLGHGFGRHRLGRHGERLGLGGELHGLGRPDGGGHGSGSVLGAGEGRRERRGGGNRLRRPRLTGLRRHLGPRDVEVLGPGGGRTRVADRRDRGAQRRDQRAGLDRSRGRGRSGRLGGGRGGTAVREGTYDAAGGLGHGRAHVQRAPGRGRGRRRRGRSGLRGHQPAQVERAGVTAARLVGATM